MSVPTFSDFTITFAGTLAISENQDCNAALDKLKQFIFDDEGTIRPGARPGYLYLDILANTILSLPDERLNPFYLEQKRIVQLLRKHAEEHPDDEAETD